jgi:hypothetical protein
MRIEHKRYILTNKFQIEAALADQANEIELLRSQLDLVQQFARDQLQMHQPYVHASDLDVSCAEPEQMKAKLAERLTKNIWCSRCSNPWPCGHIASLRILRDLGRRWSSRDDLKALAERMNKLPVPKKRDGQLDIGL